MATTWAGSVLAGAAAGTAGGAAGQLAGDALGVHQGFSFSELAMGAVGRAIAGGVTAGLQNTTTFTTGALDAAGKPVLNTGGYLLQGAGAYVGNTEAAKLSGQPASFSWAGLMGNALGKAGGGYVGTSPVNTQLGNVSRNSLTAAESSLISGVVTREATLALGDHRV